MKFFKEDDNIDLWMAIETDVQFWAVEHGVELAKERVKSLAWLVYGMVRKTVAGEYPPTVPDDADENLPDD